MSTKLLMTCVLGVVGFGLYHCATPSSQSDPLSLRAFAAADPLPSTLPVKSVERLSSFAAREPSEKTGPVWTVKVDLVKQEWLRIPVKEWTSAGADVTPQTNLRLTIEDAVLSRTPPMTARVYILKTNAAAMPTSIRDAGFIGSFGLSSASQADIPGSHTMDLGLALQKLGREDWFKPDEPFVVGVVGVVRDTKVVVPVKFGSATISAPE